MGNGRILIVDNSDQIPAERTQLLVGWGQEVSCASSASEARTRIETNGFDVLMVHIDTYEAPNFRFLSSIENVSPSTEVIVVGGPKRTEKDIVGLNLAGADFLGLPCEPDTLYSVLKRSLDRRALDREHEEVVNSIRLLRKALLIHTQTIEQLATEIINGGTAAIDNASRADGDSCRFEADLSHHRQVLRELKSFVTLLMEETRANVSPSEYRTYLSALLHHLDELETKTCAFGEAGNSLSRRELRRWGKAGSSKPLALSGETEAIGDNGQ